MNEGGTTDLVLSSVIIKKSLEFSLYAKDR